MIFYLVWMGLGLVVTTLVNALVLPSMVEATWEYVAIASSINFFAMFVLDIVIATLIHALPEKWFVKERKLFKVQRWEMAFYNVIRVKGWKEKIPELGRLCNFRKDKVATLETKYLRKFLAENRYASTMHVLMALSGFALMFANPLHLIVYYPLQMAVLNALLNIPPVFVQRYNRPKLLAVYDRQLVLEARRKTKNTAPSADETAHAGQE